MTTTINASTSSGLVVTPDNSGNVLLQYNGQSAPAFFAYATTNQTVTASSDTKILFDTEQFDTNNNFASNRFTPTVAGYYQISCSIAITNAVTGYAALYPWKNGSRYGQFAEVTLTTASYNSVGNSMLIYFNGTTDYLEMYLNAGNAAVIYGTSPQIFTYFSGCLLRGA